MPTYVVRVVDLPPQGVEFEGEPSPRELHDAVHAIVARMAEANEGLFRRISRFGFVARVDNGLEFAFRGDPLCPPPGLPDGVL